MPGIFDQQNTDQQNTDQQNTDQGGGSGGGNNSNVTPPTTGSGYPVFLQLPLLVTSASVTVLKVGNTAPARVVLLGDALGRPIDLTGCTVIYSLYINGSIFLSKPATILAVLAGMVGYSWQAGDTDTAGDYHEEWLVTDSGGGKMTVPSSGPSLMVFAAHV